jgi:hypothetical protein
MNPNGADKIELLNSIELDFLSQPMPANMVEINMLAQKAIATKSPISSPMMLSKSNHTCGCYKVSIGAA